MKHTAALARSAEPHPFRRQVAFASARRAVRRPSGITAQDVREFLMAYCACFVAVTAYIA
jgi:hypothetical protein